MSAEETTTSENGLNPQLVFQQDDALRFNCGPPNRGVGGDPSPKTTTRELAGFIDDKIFSSSATAAANDRYFPSSADFPRNMYRHWNGNGTSGEESDGDDVEDDDVDYDDDEEGDDDDDDDNTNSNNNKSSSSNKGTTTTANITTDKNNNNNNNVDKIIGNGNGKPKQHSSSSFGEVVIKDGGGSIGQSGNHNNNNNNAEADGEIYYSQYLQANEGKDMGLVENGGCGFSGRKDASSSFSSESGDSLRAILSDPVTGTLMDDAMILPCGHSFGAGGIQHIIRAKACYSCSQSITEDSIAPNLSLRAAVQAFRREEELQFYRSSKRKRERFDQDKGGFGDTTSMDAPRGRGVQFPFAVTDRVIIKGNKRTPQRFVGREAVVTTQCLNGWYVVKTLDNAESVKLQYRSLAKVSDDPSAKALSSKMSPNWL